MADSHSLPIVLVPGLLASPRLYAEQIPELWRKMANIGRPDSRPGLAAIRCPTLVLVGDGDMMTPPERAEELASGIPRARLSVIRDCGHMSTLEQPAAVTRSMVEFLTA